MISSSVPSCDLTIINAELGLVQCLNVASPASALGRGGAWRGGPVRLVVFAGADGDGEEEEDLRLQEGQARLHAAPSSAATPEEEAGWLEQHLR